MEPQELPQLSVKERANLFAAIANVKAQTVKLVVGIPSGWEGT